MPETEPAPVVQPVSTGSEPVDGQPSGDVLSGASPAVSGVLVDSLTGEQFSPEFPSVGLLTASSQPVVSVSSASEATGTTEQFDDDFNDDDLAVSDTDLSQSDVPISTNCEGAGTPEVLRSTVSSALCST